eukprot:CAMPEP_0175068432 /NCGR_PEP_ID=MMETSP0052_2-20121109/17670_1 /TAXON_ID=51329 ORGANISM="Polytomella parva, Strain SAG 63-3" /NCGR_SAMPLE_ID=MMETSP0052_2 /ASSEMBLY_ACC=CAM_ASM_000194 /LENGTH=732 /DNA_ID=CAMNT_0016335463 /DNA_START=130 /DNA_END=2324 /DNA_ORIENTATION=+
MGDNTHNANGMDLNFSCESGHKRFRRPNNPAKLQNLIQLEQAQQYVEMYDNASLDPEQRAILRMLKDEEVMDGNENDDDDSDEDQRRRKRNGSAWGGRSGRAGSNASTRGRRGGGRGRPSGSNRTSGSSKFDDDSNYEPYPKGTSRELRSPPTSVSASSAASFSSVVTTSVIGGGSNDLLPSSLSTIFAMAQTSANPLLDAKSASEARSHSSVCSSTACFGNSSISNSKSSNMNDLNSTFPSSFNGGHHLLSHAPSTTAAISHGAASNKNAMASLDKSTAAQDELLRAGANPSCSTSEESQTRPLPSTAPPLPADLIQTLTATGALTELEQATQIPMDVEDLISRSNKNQNKNSPPGRSTTVNSGSTNAYDSNPALPKPLPIASSLPPTLPCPSTVRLALEDATPPSSPAPHQVNGSNSVGGNRSSNSAGGGRNSNSSGTMTNRTTTLAAVTTTTTTTTTTTAAGLEPASHSGIPEVNYHHIIPDFIQRNHEPYFQGTWCRKPYKPRPYLTVREFRVRASAPEVERMTLRKRLLTSRPDGASEHFRLEMETLVGPEKCAEIEKSLLDALRQKQSLKVPQDVEEVDCWGVDCYTRRNIFETVKESGAFRVPSKPAAKGALKEEDAEVEKTEVKTATGHAEYHPLPFHGSHHRSMNLSETFACRWDASTPSSNSEDKRHGSGLSSTLTSTPSTSPSRYPVADVCVRGSDSDVGGGGNVGDGGGGNAVVSDATTT